MMQAASQTKAEPEDGNGKDGRADDGIIWQEMPPADCEDTYNNNIDSRMLR